MREREGQREVKQRMIREDRLHTNEFLVRSHTECTLYFSEKNGNISYTLCLEQNIAMSC